MSKSHTVVFHSPKLKNNEIVIQNYEFMLKKTQKSSRTDYKNFPNPKCQAAEIVIQNFERNKDQLRLKLWRKSHRDGRFRRQKIDIEQITE